MDCIFNYNHSWDCDNNSSCHICITMRLCQPYFGRHRRMLGYRFIFLIFKQLKKTITLKFTIMSTKTIQTKRLETFLLNEIKTTEKQLELFKKSKDSVIDLLTTITEVESDDSIQELTIIVCTPSEREILIQSLGARKKILRGKIRNNEGHMAANDKIEWSESDYLKAIKRRKVQLADTDMLKTRLENL